MPFIVGVIIVITVHNARAVSEHKTFFKSQGRADKDGQIFVITHIGLKTRRNDGYGVRCQDLRFRRFQIIARTVSRLSGRYVDALSGISRNDFKPALSHHYLR